MFAATRNVVKVAQFRELTGGVAEIAPIPLFGAELDRCLGDEDGLSFEGNAAAKAVRCSALVSGSLVVASDGGLLVPGLGDRWDPLRTRRFAGERATDAERASALLRLAHDLPAGERRIGWREALAVARNGATLASWTRESPPGVLSDECDGASLSGVDGFWVPAVWRCPEYGGRLLAVLTDAERRERVDHWAKLGADLRAFLRSV